MSLALEFRKREVGIHLDNHGQELDLNESVTGKNNVSALDLKEYEDYKDKYNRIHNYRRDGDQIVLYYNKDKKNYILISVLEDDDLGEEPFNLNTDIIIKNHLINNSSRSEGLIVPTRANLSLLTEKGYINKEDSMKILFNRKNVGLFI